ncbi:TetR/AcrR family transcriptional regulator [Pseudenhygromyxa sp. WMMC2535]|uniref:TetR/AcrR family transcriptional regulator n=1 Tax=Pseudenhygromyxa sp. WMMC2535 TaxID=2712867 RepID=UPI001556CF3E|nr:TetR/AcrR family transcriptional regulator [Pseudenhygromyxa sp. WMMC2535]NVB38550.1 TetR/AcrR family transcriptional regulator [Pseudenhygromyxa sp. WMMC2535]
MDAALQIFGQAGYHDTKITDIASAAGVATGTLYNYFSSKEDIFLSILEDGRVHLRASLTKLSEVPDPIERLRALAAVILDFLEERGAAFLIHLQVGATLAQYRTSEADEVFRRELFEIILATVAEAQDQLREDFPSETLAIAFGGLLNGVILRWIENGCQTKLRGQVDTIMELFLNGATSR